MINKEHYESKYIFKRSNGRTVTELDKMKKKEEGINFEKLKLEFKKTIRDLITSNINSNLDPIDLINQVHEEANKFKDLWKGNEEFTYGLSQKWVNMTLKYLFLLEKCPIEEDKLDAPIDSYIIKAANASEKENCYGLDINWGKSIVWSKLNDVEKYKTFQDKIKEKIEEKKYGTKIDWECMVWIEQAKVKRNK